MIHGMVMLKSSLFIKYIYWNIYGWNDIMSGMCQTINGMCELGGSDDALLKVIGTWFVKLSDEDTAIYYTILFTFVFKAK